MLYFIQLELGVPDHFHHIIMENTHIHMVYKSSLTKNVKTTKDPDTDLLEPCRAAEIFLSMSEWDLNLPEEMPGRSAQNIHNLSEFHVRR